MLERYEIAITYHNGTADVYKALEIDQNYYEINLKLGDGVLMVLPKSEIKGIRIKEL